MPPAPALSPRACQGGGGMLRSARPPEPPDCRPRKRMSDNIIVDTATRILADLCEPQTVNAAEEGHWPAELWNALEESGLTLTWVPDNLGGAGAEMPGGVAVFRAPGGVAAPVPPAAAFIAGLAL